MMPVYLTAQKSAPVSDSYSVYLFLLEDCRISQTYTDKIIELSQEYSCDSIQFQGAFPNPISQDSTIAAFVSKYKIPFPCTKQDAYELAKNFGVTVTPEVVVFNDTQNQLIYQGRIDNLFVRVGRRRRVVTSHDLEDVLNSIRNHQPIKVRKTNAIGCFFN